MAKTVKKPETRGRKKMLPENKKVAVTYFIPQRNVEAFKTETSKMVKKYL